MGEQQEGDGSVNGAVKGSQRVVNMVKMGMGEMRKSKKNGNEFFFFY